MAELLSLDVSERAGRTMEDCNACMLSGEEEESSRKSATADLLKDSMVRSIGLLPTPNVVSSTVQRMSNLFMNQKMKSTRKPSNSISLGVMEDDA